MLAMVIFWERTSNFLSSDVDQAGQEWLLWPPKITQSSKTK
jgi:hypothetical protein